MNTICPERKWTEKWYTTWQKTERSNFRGAYQLEAGKLALQDPRMVGSNWSRGRRGEVQQNERDLKNLYQNFPSFRHAADNYHSPYKEEILRDVLQRGCTPGVSRQSGSKKVRGWT